MRALMRSIMLLCVAALMLAGTWFFGWFAVPVIAAGYALARRDMRAPREAAIGALLAWLVLLVRFTSQPSFNTLLGELGQIFPVPGVAVAALALVLAMVLAVTAARLVVGIVGVRDGEE